MKATSKLLTILASATMTLASCGMIGQKISKDEALEQLTAMETALEDKYDGLDLDKIPEDLAYMYIDASGYTVEEGKKTNLKGSYFFSMMENDIYSVMKMESDDGTTKTKEENYVVQDEQGKWASWSVKNGEINSIDESNAVALGAVLVYAFMLAQATPSYALEELNNSNTTPISFKKYSDSALDCSWERSYSAEEEADYEKEIYTVSYKDNLAKSLKIEGFKKDGSKVAETTTKYTFGKKKAEKPTAPAKPAI